MFTSASVLGKRNRTTAEAMDTEVAPEGNTAKRPSGEALEMASAADLELVKRHAQRRNPELKPQVGAHHSSAMEGADGAASA